MSATEPELKFEQIKRLARQMILAPVAAMLIAGVIFVLEGMPFPGKFGRDFENFFNISPQVFDGLYLFVLALFLLTLIPVLVLLTNRKLRKIHPAVRFPVLARLIAYAWLVFFASRLMLSIYHGVLWLPEVLIRNFIFAAVLVGAYFYFKRKYSKQPDTMFP